MSPEAVGYISVGVLIVLLFLRMWIGLAMALVGFLGYAYLEGFDMALSVVGTVPFRAVGDEVVAAVPLFIFMGVIVSNSGISRDLYNTSYKWLGHQRGGLAMATVMACGGFAAVSGSSMAAAATMGKVAIPEMERYHYDSKLTAGCVAAGGTIGILIPPSMGFILYGIITEESIGKLFMAGIIPGVLEVLFYIGVIFIMCQFKPRLGPPGPKTGFMEKLASLKTTWSMLLLFLLVIGGIYGGWFTPTEAGAIGAFGSIVISSVSKQLTFKNLVVSILEAAKTTAMLVMIIIGAFILMKLMAISQLPSSLADYVGGLDFPPVVILLLIVLLYIVLGMFLDIFAAIMLTLPILFPVIISLNFDPIWYGVIMVRVMEMGLITPPMGMNVFVLRSVTDIPLQTIFVGVIPFVIADILHIALLILFPSLSLFIPNSM